MGRSSKRTSILSKGMYACCSLLSSRRLCQCSITSLLHLPQIILMLLLFSQCQHPDLKLPIALLFLMWFWCMCIMVWSLVAGCHSLFHAALFHPSSVKNEHLGECSKELQEELQISFLNFEMLGMILSYGNKEKKRTRNMCSISPFQS